MDTAVSQEQPSRLLKKVLFLSGGIILLVLLAVWLVPQVIVLHQQRRAGQLLNSILNTGKNMPAAGFFCTAIPPSPNATVNQDRANQAVAYLVTAISYQPHSSQTYLLLGRAYCLSGQYSKAVEAYQKYTLLRPDNPLGHLELGYAFEANGDNLKAIKQWNRGGVTGQDFFNRGIEMVKTGAYGEALDWFRRADIMGVAESKCFIPYTQGLILQQKGALDKAVASFQDAIQSEAGCASSAYYHIGIFQQDKLNQWSAAFQSYAEALKADNFITNSELADTYLRRGIILKYGNKNERQAMQEFQKAVDAQPSNYGALMELGWCYWFLNHNLNKSEDLLNRAINNNPGAEYAYSVLGSIYASAGKIQQAIGMYEEALKIDPSDSAIKQWLKENGVTPKTTTP